MIWFKRCLILLFIVLQPLRGMAEAQAASCEIGSVAPAAIETAAAPAHAHHHHENMRHGPQMQTGGKVVAVDMSQSHAAHHEHGKSCASCCQACGPALTADIFSPLVPSPAAPAAHRPERVPATPVENHIRPPIA